MVAPSHAELLALAEACGGPLVALDTSTDRASLCAVGLASGVVTELALEAKSQSSEAMVETLVGLLASAGRKAVDLAALVVGLGPGSFTGLRVGLATVQGLALGAARPVVGCPSLASLAASQGPGRVAVLVDARRAEVYLAAYDVDATGLARELVAPCLVPPNEAVAAAVAARCDRVAGDYAERAHAHAPGLAMASAPLRAACSLRLVAARLLAREFDALATLTPRYLKGSEAERQLMAGTLGKRQG